MPLRTAGRHSSWRIIMKDRVLKTRGRTHGPLPGNRLSGTHVALLPGTSWIKQHAVSKEARAGKSPVSRQDGNIPAAKVAPDTEALGATGKITGAGFGGAASDITRLSSAFSRVGGSLAGSTPSVSSTAKSKLSQALLLGASSVGLLAEKRGKDISIPP